MSNIGGLAKGVYETIEAKTAAYQMVPGDVGKILTNRGASGAVTMTLPDKDDIPAGWNVRVFVVADQNVVIASTEGDNIIAFNEADADSIAFQTAGDLIGSALEVVWDGTSFLIFMLSEGAVVATLVD